MKEIALSNTSTITLSSVPSGVSEPSINSIALFTIDTPSKTGAYSAHITASTVADLYGSDSLTTKMAQAIFAQTPNLRSGNGTLYVVPYVGTSATSCKWESANIVGNIASFQEVTNGSLKITLDGNSAVEATGLDFSSITDLNDVAEILNDAGFDCDFVAEQTGTTTGKITITSRRVGTESTITFASSSIGTDIGGSDYLNTTTGTVTAGVDSTNQETLAEAVTRVKDAISFGGILTTQMFDNDDIADNAETIQEYNMLWLDGTASTANIITLGEAIKSASLTHTHVVCCPNGMQAMKLQVASALSKALSVNWNGSNTANTMNLKQLATISPSSYSQTDVTNAKAKGVDLYGSTQGYSCYYSFDNGAYLDEVVMNMFLKSKLEVAGFNVLATTNTKVAQTEVGMNVVKSALERVLIQGVKNGYIAPGTWSTPSSRFGDPDTFDENIEQQGYYIYSQPISQQSQTEREARKAPLIQIAIKRSGAIQSVTGDVIIER